MFKGVEQMEVDEMEENQELSPKQSISFVDSEDKENKPFLFQTPKVKVEKGGGDLDVSEVNMKLRMSCTPMSSPIHNKNLTKSYESGDEEFSMCENGIDNSMNMSVCNYEGYTSHDNTASTASGKSFTCNTTVLLQNDKSETDESANNKNESSGNDTLSNDVPGDSSNLASSPLLIRSLKSVLNMFRPSQGSTNLSAQEVQKCESLETVQTEDLASPGAEQQNRNSSLLKSPVVFTDNIVNDLQWSDDSTIIFNLDKLKENEKKYEESLNSSNNDSLLFTSTCENERDYDLINEDTHNASLTAQDNISAGYTSEVICLENTIVIDDSGADSRTNLISEDKQSEVTEMGPENVLHNNFEKDNYLSVNQDKSSSDIPSQNSPIHETFGKIKEEVTSESKNVIQLDLNMTQEINTCLDIRKPEEGIGIQNSELNESVIQIEENTVLFDKQIQKPFTQKENSECNDVSEGLKHIPDITINGDNGGNKSYNTEAKVENLIYSEMELNYDKKFKDLQETNPKHPNDEDQNKETKSIKPEKNISVDKTHVVNTDVNDTKKEDFNSESHKLINNSAEITSTEFSEMVNNLHIDVSIEKNENVEGFVNIDEVPNNTLEEKRVSSGTFELKEKGSQSPEFVRPANKISENIVDRHTSSNSPNPFVEMQTSCSLKPEFVNLLDKSNDESILDEEWRKPSEVLLDNDVLDQFMNKKIDNNYNFRKESLFLQFDPLCRQSMRGAEIPKMLIENLSSIEASVSCVPKEEISFAEDPENEKHTQSDLESNKLDEKNITPEPQTINSLLPTLDKSVTFEDIQNTTGVNIFNSSMNTNVVSQNNVLTTSTSIMDKPIMSVSPALKIHNTNHYKTPTRASRLSNTTYASPAIAAVDQLISLSFNTPTSPRKSSMTQINEELLEKLQELKQLLKQKDDENIELTERYEDVVSQLALKNEEMTTLQNTNADFEKDNLVLKNKLQQQTLMLATVTSLVEDFENTINTLTAQRQEDKKQFESEKEEERKKHESAKNQLKFENSELTSHLTAMEHCFNDLLSKYEKSKAMISDLNANEIKHREAIKEHEKNYEILKQQVTIKINEANAEMIQKKKYYETEIVKLNAINKRHELQLSSLENSLAQKNKENIELTAICDDLLAKVQS